MPRKSPPKIRSITYGRTFNNGNYESSKIDLTVDVYPEEDPRDVFDELIEMLLEFREQERKK